MGAVASRAWGPIRRPGQYVPIDGWDAGRIGVCMLVIVLMGIALTGLSLRVIATYDRS